MNLYVHVLVYNIYRLKYMFHFHSPTPFVPAIIPSLSQPQQPQRRRLISSRYVQLYQFPFWFCSRIGISPATSTFFPSTSWSLTAILKPSNHPGRSQCGSGSCRFPVLRIHASSDPKHTTRCAFEIEWCFYHFTAISEVGKIKHRYRGHRSSTGIEVTGQAQV